MLTTHETTEMRKAWNAGHADAMAGARAEREDFRGQPARNWRNYQDGFISGLVDRRAAARAVQS